MAVGKSDPESAFYLVVPLVASVCFETGVVPVEPVVLGVVLVVSKCISVVTAILVVFVILLPGMVEGFPLSLALTSVTLLILLSSPVLFSGRLSVDAVGSYMKIDKVTM